MYGERCCPPESPSTIILARSSKVARRARVCGCRYTDASTSGGRSWGARGGGSGGWDGVEVIRDKVMLAAPEMGSDHGPGEDHNAGLMSFCISASMAIAVP
ncbi:MAG: hypothetical protein HBSAPP03_26310 [Phycisphaerae bacterium]|nr:MAG: hypothetical protein HBSAPP03_26310 [Phycisphaerae bacterium]